MSDGYKAVQSAHAAINFTFEHPSRAGPWWKDSNYLILLEEENEKALKDLVRKAEQLQLLYTVFREPDIDNQITAIAIEPHPLTKKLVRNIPLLFKSKHERERNSTQNNGDESQSSKPDKKKPIQEEIGTDR